MKFLIGFASLMLLLMIGGTLIFNRIPPAAIGIKQVVFGPGQGIVDADEEFWNELEQIR